MSDVPTHQQVRGFLDYSQKTGLFTWRERSGSFKRSLVGKIAGTAHLSGYWTISILGTKWLAHQLAWLHHYGTWPTSYVDHVNLDKRDNRIANLRLASFAENSANSSVRSDNTSGHRGVFYDKQRQRWVVLITKDGIRKQLGSFKDKNQAAEIHALMAAQVFGDFCPQYLKARANG